MQRLLTVFLLLSMFFLFSCTSMGSEKRAVQAAEKASQLFQNQEYAASGQLYREAAFLDPSQASYQYNEQLALFHLGDYEQVLDKSNASFQNFPTHLSFLFLQAKALAQQKQYEQALQVYRQIFSMNPELYAEQLEVAKQAASWGFEEEAIELARILVYEHQREKDAFALLASLEGESSWYAHMVRYLTKEDAVQSPVLLPEESSTEDGSSSNGAQETSVQDTESSL
jgi:tetratricopeptide (TPR) repeat protein